MSRTVPRPIALLQLLRQRFPTNHALAQALQITAVHAGCLFNGSRSFSNEMCLRVAVLLGREPGEILRMADKRKARFADVLEQAYGVTRPTAGQLVTTTAEEARLLRDWRRLRYDDSRTHALSELAFLAARDQQTTRPVRTAAGKTRQRRTRVPGPPAGDVDNHPPVASTPSTL